MASPEQLAVQQCLEGVAPMPGVRLVGFALIAEWQEPNGERMLTRLIGDGGNPWQAKGYFHDGLTEKWPEAEGAGDGSRHNPGHPPGWLRLN